MAISTYAELQTAITSWSHRADLASVLPDFIVLAEAKLNRELRTREMETRASLTPVAGVCTLPTDYLSLRRVYISNDRKRKMEFLTPEQLYEDYPVPVAGSKFFTIEGDSLILADSGNASDVDILYYKRLPALSDSNTTNWNLTKNPDLYLSVAMAELSDYIKDDKGVQKWKAKALSLLDSLNNSDFIGKYSGSAMRVTAV